MTELAAAFNPFEPGYMDNPYEQYGRVRDTNPVHLSLLGAWVLFAYDDVVRILRDSTLSVEFANIDVESMSAFMGDREGDQDDERQSRAMLSLDPPDHTRLRRLVAKAFNPRVIENLRPLAQGLVDRALDDAAAGAIAGDCPADLIASLAFPLPFAVISEMLGLPDDRRHEVRGWSHAIVKTLDPILSAEDIEAANAAGENMAAYVAEMVEWKRREPSDDLLSALVAVEDDGERLTTDELHDQVTLLYIAGHETTVNLIGNGLLALLRNPDQAKLLRDDPSLMPNGVEELLRYDSPVQFSRRITLHDIELGGQRIDKGAMVLTGLGSANRDPARWGDDADRLDVRREGASHHVAFGGGVHHCLGAALARLEAQVAVGTVLRRFPDAELASDTAAWNGRINLRGLDELPVVLA